MALPPAPINEPAGSFAWQQWYLALQQQFGGASGAIPWETLNFTNSDLADIFNRLHNQLQSIQGGTTGEYYHLTSAQHTSLTSLATLAAGTYTPTLTNVTNLDASTAFQAQYMRVGATVTVSGKVEVDPTATGAVELGISLPVASNFGAEEDCAGTGVMPAVSRECAAILADAANNRAALKYVATDTTNKTMMFTFTYQVI